MKSKMSNKYNVALYIRLSQEDEKNKTSESVINQKTILLEYAKKEELHVVDIYIDDGFTGLNFDRPAFNRMLEDIKNKKINMVITKDLSRLRKRLY